MGNTCSKTPTPDSVRVQEGNSSDKQSEVGEPCILCIPGAPKYLKMYYRVLKIDGFFMISFFVRKYKPKNDGTVQTPLVPICFFKMEKEPSRIEFEKSGNGGFSITTYISEETSGEIVVHSIKWESNEYTVREEDGFFFECVKKIQRTDCPDLFVSGLHPMSLIAQDASATGGGNASSASEDVSPLNGHQIEVSEQVGLGQGVSTVSQIDESATHAPEVISSDNCAEPSGLRMNGLQLSTECHSFVNFEERLYQVSITLGIEFGLLKTTITDVHKCDDLNLCQDFAQCGPQMKDSALAVKVVGRTVVSQRDIEFSSDAISPVIQRCAVNVSIELCVNSVSFSVIFVVPAEVVREIINFCRANGPDVLRTVSSCVKQIGGLLQLDYEPSKTALVLSGAVCDNSRRFLSWMFHQMKRSISCLMQQTPPALGESNVRQIKMSIGEDTTGWEIVNCLPQGDLFESSSNCVVDQNDCSASSAIEHERKDAVTVVEKFSDTKHTYRVLSKSIEFSTGNEILFVNFGIPSDLINIILVYEIEKSLFLIVIHTKDKQVYLSGHSGTSTSPVFPKAQITSYSFFGQPNLFESIEFDSSNRLHFQVNTTNWRKMFSIDNCDGSIRQLDCEWKKL
jgi:hypothetical protein